MLPVHLNVTGCHASLFQFNKFVNGDDRPEKANTVADVECFLCYTRFHHAGTGRIPYRKLQPLQLLLKVRIQCPTVSLATHRFCISSGRTADDSTLPHKFLSWVKFRWSQSSIFGPNNVPSLSNLSIGSLTTNYYKARQMLFTWSEKNIIWCHNYITHDHKAATMVLILLNQKTVPNFQPLPWFFFYQISICLPVLSILQQCGYDD